jgi:Ca2+-transporting ATPase
LTRNNLKVASGWSLDPKVDLKEAAFKSLGGVSANVEPFDKALLAVTGHGSNYSGKLQRNYPFEQAQRLSGALWQEAEKSTLYVKGAPEHVINLSRLQGEQHQSAMGQLYSLTARGYRVIAMAKAGVSDLPADLKGAGSLNFQFLGLIAFADELRPESAQAVKMAKQAGVDVRMITGDHFETAFHIGQLVGICSHKDQVILGTDLPSNEDELAKAISGKTVFARILPEQKFKILKVLKRHNIAAMTGDGVNDVPALASAEVGIAMGSGNDIAKDAGDILLMDNNFASIVNAIAEGRVIYDNIRRMLFYLLSTSFGELLTIVGALLFALPLPVSAVQVLWVNLVTDTALVIPLGLEPPEEDHMRRPPRQPKAPILDRLILNRIVLIGAIMAAVALGTFAYLVSKGYSDEYARSVAFMMLVAAQWANAFNARSERHSLFRRLRTPNYKLLAGLGLAVILQALVMLGPLRETFGVVDISFNHLLVSIFLPIIAVLTAAELHKLLAKSKTVVESN